jgi:hypothetical protein
VLEGTDELGGNKLTWWQFALLGAAGGAAVEFLSVFKSVVLWQSDRRLPTGKLKKELPAWRQYVDVPATVLVLAFRAGLGAGTATLFGVTGQIQGAYAAMAFGFAAPSILAQLGSIPQVQSIVRGNEVDAGETKGHPGEAPREDPEVGDGK